MHTCELHPLCHHPHTALPRGKGGWYLHVLPRSAGATFLEGFESPVDVALGDIWQWWPWEFLRVEGISNLNNSMILGVWTALI